MRFLLTVSLILFAFSIQAQEAFIPNSDRLYLAQFEADDTYDPFADYSEFEEAAQEEADINFFRNGRFFNLGFVVGYRTFSSSMSNIYEDNATFGLFLTYFFDLRFALQFGFLSSDHGVSIAGPSTTATGNVNFSNISFNLKYFINTQNVTRGLADLNPYIIGGLSQVYRTYTIDSETSFRKDTANSFDIGAGIEIPMMRNKMFFGVQATYHLVSFSDENSELFIDNNTEATGIKPDGDIIHILGVLGVNF